MSGGVDEQAPPLSRSQDARGRRAERQDAGAAQREADRHDLSGAGPVPEHGAHREDRWAWRRRVRANPHQLRVYRFVVAAVGLLLVLLGLATGWLPGPGGIPLVLAGLAVWASEFHWAHRLMMRLKHALHVYRAWPRRRKIIFWLCFAAGCGLLAWGYLAVVGPPAWIPVEVDRVLAVLPGVDIPG